MRAFRFLRALTSPLAFAALSYALVSPASAATLYPNPIADTASHPGGVVTADFNSDGRLDAAVATDDGVDVLLGRGDGTFAPAVHDIGGAHISGEGGPLVQADFDGDGRIDLLVPGMALFKGRGDGTFNPAVQAIFFFGFALAAGDLNGDDAPDLAVLNGDLCVLFNSGTGLFGGPICYGAATDPNSLTIADFNGDGRNDIAVTDGSHVAIYLGSGGGSFAAPTLYPNPGYGITTADLNRDGILDLLTVFSFQDGGNSYQGFVHVMLGSGLGSFDAGGSYPALVRFPVSAKSGDFNGDGIPDVAAVGDLGLDILRGAGDGSLGTAEHYFAGSYPAALAIGELDGDGRPDILVTSVQEFYSAVGDLIAFLGRADATFGQPRSGSGHAGSIAGADFNGDGHADLIAAGRSPDQFTVLFGHGDGTLDVGPSYGYVSDGPVSVVAGDFNEDSHPDVAISLGYRGMTVRLGDADGSFGSARDLPPAYGGILVTADFNGDGHLDLATTGLFDQIVIWQGRGDGQFGYASAPFAGRDQSSIAAQDLDGDGFPDLIVSAREASNGPGGFSFLRNLAGHGFAPPAYILWSQQVPAAIGIGDFNDDSIPDVVTASGPALVGDISVFPGIGDGTFGARRSFEAGCSPATMAVQDLNHDGVADIVAGDSVGYSLVVFLGDGLDGFLRQRFAVSRAFALAVGDFLQDGAADVGFATTDGLVGLAINQRGGVPPNHGPTAVAGPDQTRECTAASGTPIQLDGGASSDPDSTPGTQDDIVLFEWFEGYGTPARALLGQGTTRTVSLAPGPHSFTLKVTDRGGRASADGVLLDVQDTQAPSLSATLPPGLLLWPPNHRMIPVTVQVAASDLCGPVAWTLESLTSSEPDDDPGTSDGETSDDIQGATAGSPDTDFRLRAERSAAASGRTYLVTYRAVDGAGNTTTSTLPVQVPHDVGGVVDPLTLRLSETGAGTLIQWDPVPGAVEYDIAAGDLGFFLDPTVSFGPPVCYAGHLMATSNAGIEIPDLPEPGTGFFFVVEYHDTARRGYGTENSPYDLTPLVPEDICP